MKRTLLPAVVIAALAFAGSAGAAPVKRLAWAKVATAWTTQAKARGYATTCSTWPGFGGSLRCAFYNPAPDPNGTTFVVDGKHHVYGSLQMARYDLRMADVGRKAIPGCTYLFGRDDERARLVVNICDEGWLARVPRVR